MMPALVIGLMLVGLVLMVIEVLVLPGFGVVGVLGGLAMVVACWLAYTNLGPGYGALALAVGVVSAALMFWLLPKTKAGRKMILETAHVGSAARPALKELLGKEGEVLSVLRPAGAVAIDDRPVDVVTDGQYVEIGTRVRVIRVEGARVVVEPLEEPS